MLTVSEIKAEGEPAADGSGRSGNNGRSGTVFISGGFHRQTLAPTHHCVSGLPSHLIWLGGNMDNQSPHPSFFLQAGHGFFISLLIQSIQNGVPQDLQAYTARSSIRLIRSLPLITAAPRRPPGPSGLWHS